MGFQLSNSLNLEPDVPAPTLASSPPSPHNVGGVESAGPRELESAPFQTEFPFQLPKGYVDSEGNVHRHGVMRLAKAIDEIVPMRDPRVKSNPAYATVIILSRVIVRLGALADIPPVVVEGMFACDLDYLQKFYRHINQLEEQAPEPLLN